MALILAVPRRLAEGAAVLMMTNRGMAGPRLGCSATHLGQAPGNNRHGEDRPSGGAARPCSACGFIITIAVGCRQDRGGAHRDVPSLDQMLARMDIIPSVPPHARNLSPAFRAPPQAHPSQGISSILRAAGDRRECAGAAIASGDIAGAGLDMFEHEPAVNPKLVKLARTGGRAAAAHGIGHRGRPHRHGREGHRQHQTFSTAIGRPIASCLRCCEQGR